MLENKYYSKKAEKINDYHVKILFPDKSMTNRPLVVKGMRMHDIPAFFKLLDPDKLWTLQELRELEDW